LVRACGVLHFLYFLLSSALALYLVGVLILVADGDISAPWIFKPVHLLEMVGFGLLAVLSAAVGYGLLLLRRWTWRLEVIFLVGYVAVTVPAIINTLVREGAAAGLESFFGFGVIGMPPVLILLSRECARAISEGPRPPDHR
jgi:hypothetical protein